MRLRTLDTLEASYTLDIHNGLGTHSFCVVDASFLGRPGRRRAGGLEDPLGVVAPEGGPTKHIGLRTVRHVPQCEVLAKTIIHDIIVDMKRNTRANS